MIVWITSYNFWKSASTGERSPLQSPLRGSQSRQNGFAAVAQRVHFPCELSLNPSSQTASAQFPSIHSFGRAHSAPTTPQLSGSRSRFLQIPCSQVRQFPDCLPSRPATQFVTVQSTPGSPQFLAFHGWHRSFVDLLTRAPRWCELILVIPSWYEKARAVRLGSSRSSAKYC
jgi:hypothetical protein